MENNKKAINLYNLLKKDNIIGSVGKISFKLADIKVDISTTDTVGQSIQSWLKQYMVIKKIPFAEKKNTQEFPDFMLNPSEKEKDFLEVKAFIYSNGPAFDVANFESYCDLVKKNPYILDTDYLIFGYSMNGTTIKIEDIWLKKIWQITSISKSHPLRIQAKRDKIYNIRPCTWYSTSKACLPAFTSKEQFIKAIYSTLKEYNYSSINADNWLKDFKKNYKHYYNDKFNI